LRRCNRQGTKGNKPEILSVHDSDVSVKAVTARDAEANSAKNQAGMGHKKGQIDGARARITEGSADMVSAHKDPIQTDVSGALTSVDSTEEAVVCSVEGAANVIWMCPKVSKDDVKVGRTEARTNQCVIRSRTKT
jgi:hypothetical protein